MPIRTFTDRVERLREFSPADLFLLVRKGLQQFFPHLSTVLTQSIQIIGWKNVVESIKCGCRNGRYCCCFLTQGMEERFQYGGQVDLRQPLMDRGKDPFSMTQAAGQIYRRCR